MSEKLTSVSAGIKAYRKACGELLNGAKMDARKMSRDPVYIRDFPNSRPTRWHFVGRGCELIAIDDKGERNDDLGGPEFLEQKELSVAGLRDTAKQWLRYGPSRQGRYLTALSMNHGLDVYDDFHTYMEDMKYSGCGDYSIWDDWATQDIPIELFNIEKEAA